MDPSEKPEERPKTAASTQGTPVEETNATTDKDKDEASESSSWAPPTAHLIPNSSPSKRNNQFHQNYHTCFHQKILFRKNIFPFYLSHLTLLSRSAFYLWNKDIAPPHKASNLWPSHWGHFDTITSITWPLRLSEAIWHDKWAVWWLRWALCVCVAVCTDWPVRGEGGPVSRRRRRCTTVHQPLCHLGQPHTHRNPALMFICENLFCDKYTDWNTVLCSVYLSCLYVLFLVLI